jgi:hypothetical protein
MMILSERAIKANQDLDVFEDVLRKCFKSYHKIPTNQKN